MAMRVGARRAGGMPVSSLPALRVLFVVDGFTDIRFVVGLSKVCDLTLLVPAKQFLESGLDVRIAESKARVDVHQLPGGRLAFQRECFAYLWRHAREFDVI